MANMAFKFRIYPNKEQRDLLARTFGCVRFIYNQMLADKIDYYNETKKMLNNQSHFLPVLNQVIGNTISITKLTLKISAWDTKRRFLY